MRNILLLAVLALAGCNLPEVEDQPVRKVTQIRGINYYTVTLPDMPGVQCIANDKGGIWCKESKQ